MTDAVTLEQWLAALIERLSDPVERARMAPLFGDRWTLRLCFAGKDKPGKSWAEVGYRSDPGDFVVVMKFGKQPRARGRFERVTELPFSFLMASGELLQDTKEHEARRL